MFRSLRLRLILSHTLPLLVVIPLVGIALIYFLETQVLLPSVTDSLAKEAAFLAEIGAQQGAMWQDAEAARGFVADHAARLEARLMLLDPQGRLLASSDPADDARLGEVLSPPGLARAQAGEVSLVDDADQRLGGEAIDIVAPARAGDGRTLGFVRLSHRLTSVVDDFVRLRFVIAGVLGFGLLIGAAAGWLLALDLANPLRRLAGAIRLLAASRQPLAVPRNGPDEIVGLIDSYNQMLEQLRAAEGSRRQLLANVVHEIGRPLGAMRSAVQALRAGAGEDPELGQALLAGLEGETLRLERLLDDLSGLHDQLTGTLALVKRPVDLTPWLERVLATWGQAAEAKGLRWRVSLPEQPVTIQGDADRLAQAVENLLSNAVKYTPAGGEVTVTAAREGGGVAIRVADTGPGISPAEQERVFEPLYRGQASGRFPQGMGLGLTIARDLVAAHGGRLTLRSEAGGGTAFTVWLPLQRGDL